VQKCVNQSPTGQLRAQEKTNIPKQRIEFREMALVGEEKFLKACALATESEKPMCKYGPMCERLRNPEWRAHHAHKYKHPGVALKLFMLGSPRCGKTEQCALLETKIQRHSSQLWLKVDVWQLSKVVLRFPNLINHVFDSDEVTTASMTARSSHDAALPNSPHRASSCGSPSAVVQADDLTNGIIQCLLSSEQKGCGWILENFPRSVGQFRIMFQAGVVPHCVVNIEGALHEDGSGQEILLYRERHAVLAEMQRCGITIITVTPPNAPTRTQSGSSMAAPQSCLPVKRAASGSSIPLATSQLPPSVPSPVRCGLHEQICAGIEACLQNVAVAPYAMAIPKQAGKRCESKPQIAHHLHLTASQMQTQ
jgi:hypothetical protein